MEFKVEEMVAMPLLLAPGNAEAAVKVSNDGLVAAKQRQPRDPSMLTGCQR